MGAVGNKLNLVDIATMKDPSGRIGKVAEILTQSNPMIDHIPWIEGNLDTGERLMVRKTLGAGAWRRINEGVAPSKSVQTQMDEVTGLYEDWMEVDEKLLKMSGDQTATLLNQSRAKFEAATQEIVGTLLYGNIITSPKEFHGFFPRLDSLNTTPSSGPIVLGGGGTGTDNLSMLFVGWGEGKVYGVYPKGSKAGLEFNPIGFETKDESGLLRRVHRSQFIWEAGLAIADTRYVSAIRNIDISDLATFGTSTDTSAKLTNIMIDALSYIPNVETTDVRVYVPRAIWAGLTKMANDSNNRNVSRDLVDGKFITNFFGARVHMMEAFVTETAVIS